MTLFWHVIVTDRFEQLLIINLADLMFIHSSLLMLERKSFPDCREVLQC